MKFRESNIKPMPRVGEYWMGKYSYNECEPFSGQIRKVRIEKLYVGTLSTRYYCSATIFKDDGSEYDGSYSFKLSELFRKTTY
jgi:hypothetical protein